MIPTNVLTVKHKKICFGYLKELEQVLLTNHFDYEDYEKHVF